MTETEIRVCVERQRRYFYSGATLPVEKRIRALRKLYRAVREHEEEIADALAQDLGKSSYESYMTETGMVLSEISYMLKHIRAFASVKAVKTPLAQFRSKSYQIASPYGVTLIMSPWNYPVLLTLGPLVDALAAGNTAVVKPSAYAPASSGLLCRMLGKIFPEEYVTVITGGRAENTALLGQHFDYIFFTGSQRVGKEVLRKAAEYLTPATLELGGKSPCIIEKTADIRMAARRVVFGKYLNCGQTCVAPDYVWCDSSVREEFLQEVKKQIRLQYGENPLENRNYGHIINEKHFRRICRLIDDAKVAAGGRVRPETLQIEPTVMTNVTREDAVMQEEIFGPLLPILEYESLEEVIREVNSGQHPLALYLFTEDKKIADRVMNECAFGGGCVNDTIIHLATTEMPFGGFGESGMGSYHGKAGFDTFTHRKSIVNKDTKIDLPMRYQPYDSRINEWLCRKFMR